MIGLKLGMVGLLIVATAFFVAAEFAFVRIRSSRIDQLVLEGHKKALSVQRILSNLDGYLSACQLGITVTALGLGWLGEPTVEEILHPLFHYFGVDAQLSNILSFVIAFSSVTFIHVVLGELAPKTLAIQQAENVSLWLSQPMILFYKVLYPFIWTLNGSARVFVGLFGLKPAKEHEEAHTEDELRLILSDSYQNGEINQSEFKYVNRIFNFDELTAREIMIPRIDLMVLNVHDSLEKNMDIMREENYTRFPVIDEDKDEIIGFIHTKEFFMEYATNKEIKLSSFIRPILIVHENIAIKDLLRKMQVKRIHFAILTDEYGGTSGLVTLEDILEEIVGEIRDEFDEEEQLKIDKVKENEYIFDGKVLINEVNDLLGANFDNHDVDTIGGWLFSHDSQLEENKMWEFEQYRFTVLEGDKNRYKRIKLQVV
jgi:CBS domain containing-hemolysin-like protein